MVEGKYLILAEGEAVEGIDFAIETGGIITGRVTDAEGRPVVAERVTVTQIIETERGGIRRHSQSATNTDKSGVYRIYALPAGRYILSAGGPTPIFGRLRPADRRHAYWRAFHPDVTDEAQAKVIELAAGTEAANVDIKLGPQIRLHAIAGRLIDAETGRVVPNGAETVRGQIKVEGGALPDGALIGVDSRRISPDGAHGRPYAHALVDSRGHFTLEGMTVGDHELTLRVGNASTTPLTRHLINVEKGKETNVILTLNLGAKADSR